MYQHPAAILLIRGAYMDTNNRYSVLFVDDEEDVIQIIMKKLDWESMGLQIIGHAGNGVEA